MSRPFSTKYVFVVYIRVRFRPKATKEFFREAEEKEQKKKGGLKMSDMNVEKLKSKENLMSPDATNIWLMKKRDKEENKKEIKTRVKETRKKMKIQHKIYKSLKENLRELKKKKVMKREDREQEKERELLQKSISGLRISFRKKSQMPI